MNLSTQQLYSLKGMQVREATLLPRRDPSGKDAIRLVLTPADKDEISFFESQDLLDESGAVRANPNSPAGIEVPLTMLESLISPDETGTPAHKVAMLRNTFVKLQASYTPEFGLMIEAGANDTAHRISGNSAHDMRPTLNLERKFGAHIRQEAESFWFTRIRGLFQPNHGSLLPKLEDGKKLTAWQRDVLKIVSPYSNALCSSPDKAKVPGQAKMTGDYLTLDQRSNTLAQVLEMESFCANLPNNEALHGHVTLAEMLGSPTDTTWSEMSNRKLDEIMRRDDRLATAPDNLGAHAEKMTQLGSVASNLEKLTGQTLTDEQKKETRELFNQFLLDITAKSEGHFKPIQTFCSSLGIPPTSSTKQTGLAILHHVASLKSFDSNPDKEYRLKDGTPLDFSSLMTKAVADSRIFGEKLPNLKTTQQAAAAAVLFQISETTLHAYWEQPPMVSAQSLHKLAKLTERDIVDHLMTSKRGHKNPTAFTKTFLDARNLMQSQVELFLASAAEDENLTPPPKSMTARLMACSDGRPDVTQSRGLLLRTAVRTIYSKANIADEQVDSLLHEAANLSSKPNNNYKEQVNYLSQTYGMNRAEAAVTLLMADAIQDNNFVLMQKLDTFGEGSVGKDAYHQKMEAALDTPLRAQNLSIYDLSRQLSASPDSLVKAIDPASEADAQMANIKASMVAKAAMGHIEQQLLKTAPTYNGTLRNSLTYRNMESPIMTGTLGVKFVDEQIHQGFTSALDSFLRISAIRDSGAREQRLLAEGAALKDATTTARNNVEAEAERCYPHGRSPKKAALDLLKQGMQKAFMGVGGGGEIFEKMNQSLMHPNFG